MRQSQPIQQYMPENLDALAAIPTPAGKQAIVDSGTVANLQAPAQTQVQVAQATNQVGQNMVTKASQDAVNTVRTVERAATEAAGQSFETTQALNIATENALSSQAIAQDLLSRNVAMMQMVNGAGDYTAKLGDQLASVPEGGRDPRADVAKMITLANSMKPKRA